MRPRSSHRKPDGRACAAHSAKGKEWISERLAAVPLVEGAKWLRFPNPLLPVRSAVGVAGCTHSRGWSVWSVGARGPSVSMNLLSAALPAMAPGRRKECGWFPAIDAPAKGSYGWRVRANQ